MSGISDKTTDALSAAVNFRQMRHGVVSSNIANADTPGYKAKVLDFEDALQTAMDQEGLGKMHTSHPEHYLMGEGSISRSRADIYDNPEVNVTNDQNTVDMEKEMANLSENLILYKAAVQMINKKLGLLRYAASDGGR